MRQPDPLILGAGPAGCAAAITLARGGARPVLIDRSRDVGDPLCGGFLSWQTARQLAVLGVDCAKLGAQEVSRLRLFSGGRRSELPLPHLAFGLSRHALDKALREVAIAAGAQIEFDQIAGLQPGTACGKRREWRAETLFLATGKEDIRGQTRPRRALDPALGVRLRLPASAQRSSLLSGVIELHLFRHGYAGIVLQEDGTANICLALRKSAFAAAGGRPDALFSQLASQSPPLAQRLGEDWRSARCDTIGAIPYGWIARDTTPGLYRLGDQAAVIASLAGEGIGIGLASGQMAAAHWLHHGAKGASAYQQAFARAARRPMQAAALARWLAEKPLGAQLAHHAATLWPGAITAMAALSRITLPPTLAQYPPPA